jgi:hypothetical protein
MILHALILRAGWPNLQRQLTHMGKIEPGVTQSLGSTPAAGEARASRCVSGELAQARIIA